MILNDNFFKKVENKTKVDKDTIINLASKLQNNNLKDEATLREVIRELSNMTGKNVSKEQEDKIIDTIVKDKVPKDLDKFVDDNL
ncbi:MAG TPA: sporulation protein [Mollicutes bacterium]|nr:sporulation protein [Mollicutes bacterium]